MARFVNIDVISPEPYEVQVGGRVFDLASTDLTGTAAMARAIQSTLDEAESDLTDEAIARQLALYDSEVEAMAALMGKVVRLAEGAPADGPGEGERATAAWLQTVLNNAQMAALMEACVEFVMFGGDSDPKAGGGGEPTE